MTTATINPDKIEITVEALPEDVPIEGNYVVSGDDEYDRQCEVAVRERVKHNQWAWCIARVIGKFHGLTAHAYLGECSYSDAQDFKTNSGHFEDMRDEVTAELQATFKDMCDDCDYCE